MKHITATPDMPVAYVPLDLSWRELARQWLQTKRRRDLPELARRTGVGRGTLQRLRLGYEHNYRVETVQRVLIEAMRDNPPAGLLVLLENNAPANEADRAS